MDIISNNSRHKSLDEDDEKIIESLNENESTEEILAEGKDRLFSNAEKIVLVLKNKQEELKRK